MTIIISKVASGMCNRLVPFLTGLRLAKKLNTKYYIYWDDNCTDTDYSYMGERTSYSDMFEYIKDVNHIQINELHTLLNTSNKLIVYYCKHTIQNYTIEELLQYDVIFFNDYTHPISIKNDDTHISSYSDSMEWVSNNSNYGNDIKNIFELLIPKKYIQDKINEVLLHFPENKDNIIGIHLRHWPSIWLKNQNVKEGNNYDNKIEYMNKCIKQNPETKFYICSSDITLINNTIKLFGDKIIYFKNRFGETHGDMYYSSDETTSRGNKNLNINGVVDMYAMSKCNTILGNKGSSYSLSAALLNKKSIYMV